MTGQNIYEIASSFLYERDAEDYDSKEFAVNFINVLLQESLPYENSIREWNAETLLTAAPEITALTDTIAYNAALTRVALPYGLASFFFQEAMDNFQAENYRNKYLSALRDAMKMNQEDTVDVYASDYEVSDDA
jgi:hypothetical protein